MRRVLVAAVALTVALGACGDDDATSSPTLDERTARSSAPVTAAPPAASTTSSTASTTSTTSTTEVSTTTVPPTLPTPLPPPIEDGSTEETFEVARIEIPKIGLSRPMYEGIRLSTLDRGPGHWPGTAMPGEPGNVVVAGHRVSHNADFRHLDRLDAGDEVIMSTLAGRFVYRVVSVVIVGPDALWIVDQTPARTATLFACHPPGSVRERIVAHLELSA
jgi:sortase A